MTITTPEFDVAGGGALPGRDWTKGSIVGNLLRLSWPILISQSLNMIGPTIDMIWVGKLGAAPIAGVGVGGMVIMMMTSALMGFTVGARAMVARFVGAGDARGANDAARQAFVISAMFAALIVTVGIPLAEPILVLMGVEADVVAEGVSYMRIMFIGSAIMAFRMMADSIMQASGDAITPMRIAIFFRLVHVALCPFLVLGWWFFPRLGVSGAALTNVFSQGLGLVLAFWVLFTGRTRLRLTLANFRVDLNIIGRIVRIGIPAAVVGMQRNLGHVVLISIMASFGTLAVAAHTISQRVEGIMVMFIMGPGLASGVLGGQNLGAGSTHRAERSGWLALGFAEGIMVICSLAIFLWAEEVVRIFNAEPALVEITSSFLRIAAAGFLVLSLVIDLRHFLSGVGDTLPPMLFEILNMWVVLLPLALLFPRFTHLGAYGVRWAMVCGTFVGGLAQLIYFWQGRWKHKKV